MLLFFLFLDREGLYRRRDDADGKDMLEIVIRSARLCMCRRAESGKVARRIQYTFWEHTTKVLEGRPTYDDATKGAKWW